MIGFSEWQPPDSPRKSPVLPDSFTQIYIIFLKGLHIGPPKMYRRFCIGLPKMHRQFCIGLTKIPRRFRIGSPKMHKRFCIGPQSFPTKI